MRLKNKVAVITGAASGIGRATCLLFAKEGAKVVIVDYNKDQAEQTLRMIRKYKGKGLVIQTDISKSNQVQEMVGKVIETYDKIDILVNNAAIVIEGDLLSITEEDWDKTINTNLKGAYLCCKYVIPEMLNTNKEGGAIINIGSDAGILPEKNQFAYNVSKSGIIGLTRAIARDFSSKKIRSNCVCPGAIETEMMKAFLIAKENPTEARREREKMRPIGRLGTPEEIAYGIIYFASDESAYTTGAVLSIDGGRTSQ